MRMLPVLLLAALLGACSTSSTTVSGLVVGSVYRNAVVCYDTDSDGSCANEQSVSTDADGRFTIVSKQGDLLAEVGPGTIRYEPADGTTVALDATARATFRLHASMVADQAIISALSTQVAAELDAGASRTDAMARVAARAGVAADKVLVNLNTETDAATRGLLKAYADRVTTVLQGVAGNSKATPRRDALRTALTAPSSQKGTVQYAWTQIGADDTPFSKLEITGTSIGALGDAPGAANAAAVASTRLQTDGAALRQGKPGARAIVLPDASGAATCPGIAIDGVLSAMATRAPIATAKVSNGPKYGSPAPVDFKVLTCEAPVPASARSASINGMPVKLTNTPVNRVVVVGDTGCRLKGPSSFIQAADGTSSGGDPLQDCTDEASWPWAKLAKMAASFGPDLVIHNGDIHYREGFPYGVQKRWGGAANAANGGSEQDNTAVVFPKFQAAKIDDSITYGWRSWEEDFFKATGPLLSSAPWAITRGNHELCDRAAQGWFRFLDPRRFPAGEPEYDSAYVRGSSFSVSKFCSQHIDPVAMTIGDLQIVLLDASMMNSAPGLTSSIGSTNLDHIRTARQLSQVSALADSNDASKVTWIVSHKPFFAYSGGAANAGNSKLSSAGADTWQLQKAIEPGTESVASGNGKLPANTQMTHAGHIHGFQMITHPGASGLPMNILMGSTGDNLEGLIEANTGTALAAKGWGNSITSGAWPWFDQTISGLSVAATRWYGSFAQLLPLNFSSSAVTGAGKKESAVMVEYSFLVIDRIPGKRDWTLRVYDKNRTLLRTCTTSGKSATCDG